MIEYEVSFEMRDPSRERRQWLTQLAMVVNSGISRFTAFGTNPVNPES